MGKRIFYSSHFRRRFTQDRRIHQEPENPSSQIEGRYPHNSPRYTARRKRALSPGAAIHGGAVSAPGHNAPRQEHSGAGSFGPASYTGYSPPKAGFVSRSRHSWRRLSSRCMPFRHSDRAGMNPRAGTQCPSIRTLGGRLLRGNSPPRIPPWKLAFSR
jgi:hypothetical protein